MNDLAIRRVTGWCGIIVGGLGAVAVPLYFIHEGAPPAWNVLTRVMLNLVNSALILVFFAGLRELVKRADREAEWLASLMFGCGLAYATVTMIAGSLEAGVVYDAEGTAVDPTVHGLLADANILLHGSVGRLLTALALIAAGCAVARCGRLLPRWLSLGAFVAAAINLAFVPSLFASTDPAQFYSALGWGNTALTAALVTYWALAVGIVVLARGGRAPVTTARPPSSPPGPARPTAASW